MSKEYLFKDVLFGLRPEYLAMEEKLRRLKRFSVVLDKNIEDFSYFIFKYHRDMKPEIGCKFKKKENFIEKKLCVLTSSLGYIKGRSTILVSDNNNNYNMREANFPIMLDNDSYKERIYELIQNILNSEFANNMCIPYINKEIFYDEFIFKIRTTHIDLEIKNALMQNIISFLPDDIIRICLEDPKHGQELLNFIFNDLPFPNDMLNEYQQDIIIQNNPFNKSVYVPEINKYKEKFSIEETPKQFVLRK